MIKSMTGFGSASLSNEFFNLSIDIKSVNSRYLDYKIKLPKEIEKYESDLISNIVKVCKRGRISVIINLDSMNSELNNFPEINKSLFKSYNTFVDKLNKEFNLNFKINDLFEIKDFILRKKKINVSKKSLLFTFENALKKLEKMKLNEGTYLFKDIKKRIVHLDKTIKKINDTSNKNSLFIKHKYLKKIKKFVNEIQIDESRLAMEAGILSEKIDITEECVRFNSHLQQILKLIEKNNPIGKKLNFILQELLRETNTIGSKSNDIKIINLVMVLKEEIEKIKEQSQNIL
ncbi:MAG: YicC family protein [Candidatus Marinimicrobia bacterium]|nr:YicC family protein [Candidatus Neomarinimicrobiota bacterium]OUW50628.1 MAG: YicC family protein [bacterium TMED190]|tara:strand:+ start:90 stop:956 length:867 start_codon:yes stop_codon:yes gene_type:complete